MRQMLVLCKALERFVDAFPHFKGILIDNTVLAIEHDGILEHNVQISLEFGK